MIDLLPGLFFFFPFLFWQLTGKSEWQLNLWYTYKTLHYMYDIPITPFKPGTYICFWFKREKNRYQTHSIILFSVSRDNFRLWCMGNSEFSVLNSWLSRLDLGFYICDHCTELQWCWVVLQQCWIWKHIAVEFGNFRE